MCFWARLYQSVRGPKFQIEEQNQETPGESERLSYHCCWAQIRGTSLRGHSPVHWKSQNPPFLCVEGGTKTLANEVFLWGGCRSHTMGHGFIRTVVGHAYAPGLSAPSVRVWHATGLKAWALSSLFFMGSYLSFITEINAPFRTSLGISKLSCPEAKISSV